MRSFSLIPNSFPLCILFLFSYLIPIVAVYAENQHLSVRLVLREEHQERSRQWLHMWRRVGEINNNNRRGEALAVEREQAIDSLHEGAGG